MSNMPKESEETGVAFRAGVRGLPFSTSAAPTADVPVETDTLQGPVERSFELLERLSGLSDPVAAYETGRAMRMIGHILDSQSSPPEHGTRVVQELAGATIIFGMRGERQPWGAEDTAFVFLDVFTGGAGSSAQREHVRKAIVDYARKRPVVARKA